MQLEAIGGATLYGTTHSPASQRRCRTHASLRFVRCRIRRKILSIMWAYYSSPRSKAPPPDASQPREAVTLLIKWRSTWNDATRQGLIVIEPFYLPLWSCQGVQPAFVYTASARTAASAYASWPWCHPWSTLQLVASRMEEGSRPGSQNNSFSSLIRRKKFHSPHPHGSYHTSIGWSRKVFIFLFFFSNKKSVLVNQTWFCLTGDGVRWLEDLLIK
ncbi:hypothetical protein SEVIR_9G543150v4 [Setaria viridis]